jgi:hypothetical protein
VIKRPLSVIVIAAVLIATGAGGLVFHLADLWPIQYDLLLATLVRVIAVVCGIYLLRARNWARWLSLTWIAFHVVISLLHSWLQLGIHILVCAAFAYFLFRPHVNEYFRARTAK